MRASNVRWMGAVVILLLLAGCSSSAQPQPGTVFNGTIEMGEQAGSGTLSFKVSADGAAITELSVSLKSVNCKDMISMGSVADFQSNPGISITDGKFQGSLPAMGGMVTDYRFNPADSFPTAVPDPSTVGNISGQFTSSTQANGAITIYLAAMMSDGIVCELGAFEWSASGK